MSIINVKNLPEDVASRIKNVYNYLKMMNEYSNVDFFYKVPNTDVIDPNNPDYTPFIVRGKSLIFHYPGNNYNHCDVLEKHQKIWFWTNQTISEYKEEMFLSSKVECPLDLKTSQHNNKQKKEWTYEDRQWKFIKVMSGIEYYTVTDPEGKIRVCIALVRGQYNTHFPKIYKRLAKDELSLNINHYKRVDMEGVTTSLIALLEVVDPISWAEAVRKGKIACDLSSGFKNLHMQMNFNDKTRGFSMSEIKDAKKVRKIKVL